MGFNPAVRTETWGGSDKSWIRTRHGLADMLPIMIDVSLFALGHVVNGLIPSGTALGVVTSSGLYGPYGRKANESASIAVDATGGTWRITFQGQTTANIAFNATAAAVQAAMELLPDIDAGDILVTGGPGVAGGGTPYVVTFLSTGQYGGADAPAITTVVTGTPPLLTGGAATAAVTTTAGGSTVSDGRQKLVGHLFEDFKIWSGPIGAPITPDPATASDGAAALFHMGIVLESKLPVFDGIVTAGKVDAAGKADVSSWIKYV